jgi:hypothetical protein
MRVLSVVLAWLCVAPAFSQTYYPSGPKTDVALSTVTGGGWSLCAQTGWNEATRGLPASCAATDKLMLACRLKDSATIKLLAAAPASDVLTETGTGMTNTHNANGSEWYYQPPTAGMDGGEAMGFATGGDDVTLGSCDTNNTGTASQRLCFHLYKDIDNGGYRCGTYTSNSQTTYQKLFFMSDADGDLVADSLDYYPQDASRSVKPIVPVPTLPIFGLLALAGLLGLFGLRKLRQ